MALFEARTPFFVTLKGNPPKRNTTNLRVPLRKKHARIEHPKDCLFLGALWRVQPSEQGIQDILISNKDLPCRAPFFPVTS